MKVITARVTDNFMGPLGIGPIIWNHIKAPWMHYTTLSKGPSDREQCDRQRQQTRERAEEVGEEVCEPNPVSTRYYKAIDAVDRRTRLANCQRAWCPSNLTRVFP